MVMDFILQKGTSKSCREGWSQRLNTEDALQLYRTPDLNAVGRLATMVSERKVGNQASYIINRYINYSNYCILSCQFCSFSRKKRNDDGFELSVEEIVTKAKESLKLGITELHIVMAFIQLCPASYYTDMLKALKAVDSELIKVFYCRGNLPSCSISKRQCPKYWPFWRKQAWIH